MAGKIAAELEPIADALAHDRRRNRQEAARILAEMAREDPGSVLPVADVIVEALEYPEAQTRWECLEALRALIAADADAAAEGFSGAEETLFDEGSPAARMAAFRYLSALAGSSKKRSQQVWPLLSEALMCYHGDPEYRDMLACMRELAQADIAASVRAELGSRMEFDARNGRGRVRTIAKEILDLAKAGA